MSFLTINGIEVPVLNDGASASQVEIGKRSRAFDGTLRSTRQRTKREYNFETPPVSEEEADALRGLIRGEGHTWSLSNLYSSKGLGPSAQSGTVTNGTPSTPKYGFALFLSGGGALASATWQPGVTTDWTVAVWRTVDGGTNWSHHVVRSDGSKWLNGAASGAATTWLTVSAPNLKLEDTSTPTAVMYDDLIFFPYSVPAAWVATLYGKSTAWPDTPLLTAAGDVMPSTSVQGEVSSSKFVQCALDGVWTTNAQALSFVLSEV